MNEYKIGDLIVTKEIYHEYIKEKNKIWIKLFPCSFLLCFVVVTLIFWFWFKITGTDIKSIKEKGYETCQDFYNGKLKYDLILKEKKEWKKL